MGKEAKYIVRLSAEERKELEGLVARGRVAKATRQRAMILLWADEGFGVRAVEALHATYTFPPGVTLHDGGTLGLMLYESVAADKPLDKLFSELIAADGADEKQRAMARFLLNRDAEPNLLTRDIGRIEAPQPGQAETVKANADQHESTCPIDIRHCVSP